MKKLLAISILNLLISNLFAQGRLNNVNNEARLNTSTKKTEFFIQWNGLKRAEVTENDFIEFLHFTGACYSDIQGVPYFNIKRNIPQNTASLSVRFKNATFKAIDDKEASYLQSKVKLANSVEDNHQLVYNKGKKEALVTILPFRKNSSTGKIELLESFDLELIPVFDNAKKASIDRTFATNSVLQNGNWHKISVTKSGVYKIDYNFLQSMGMEPANIDPRNIRIYGNGGGMLPFDNSIYRHDDLKENAIYVEGENDGVFNQGDYILFYAEGPNEWKQAGTEFDFTKNLYSDSTYYFITVDLGTGKRIQTQNSLPTFDVTVNTFNDFAAHESDQKNLIKTGRRWFGEEFNIVQQYDFVFSFPNVVTSSLAKLEAAVAAHCVGCNENTNYFDIDVVGQSQTMRIELGGVSSGYTARYADVEANSVSFNPSSSTFNIKVFYNKPKSDALGWLDYLIANVRRSLTMAGDQMMFRDINSVGNGTARFQLASATNVRIWETTNPLNVKEQSFSLSGSTAYFNVTVDSLRTFIAFKDKNYLVPKKAGKVENQNLHSLPQVDMIVISPPQFLEEANELAEFHIDEDNLTVNVATTKQIYNEFSSGAQDITAIKDFVKMFYDRAGGDTTQMPKYLLLFGDGSYDPKNRVPGNTNFIPNYESWESTLPTSSYVSDDYYGLLDDFESDGASEIIDLGIGRLTVKNKAEAQAVVDKIKHYYSKQTMGPWRNWLAFVGDDEDNGIHMRDSDSLANKAGNLYPDYNIDKLYFDAYKQEATPGGERYPAVKDGINNRIAKGALMMTYVGHGGELGWSHERVLEVSDINSWTNLNNLPLFLTATCEFSRYDDPQRTAAGEYVLINPNGGGIALLTTTRLVYSTPNFELAKVFYDNAFSELDGEPIKLGDLYKFVKSTPQGVGTNSRNFSLLGDPALTLAYPKFDVVTTKINGNPVSSADTIRALSKVTVSGYVADKQGQKMDDFNGIIYPTVFDKPTDILTLNNDGQGVFSFQIQKNMIFNGKASVKSGEFEFTFVVPKDIAYKFGNGRISYYAENGETDANGYYDGFVVGGSDENAVADNQGPDVDLYLNDENFVQGGLTDENPDLYAKVFDENGINTVGSGIGHDIVGVLDENTGNSINLNDFYESDLDSYQSGSVRYPFSKLSEGKHTLRLKVWDTHNNSGEGYTEFVVAESAELALDHVLNYPNPFTTKTSFFFEHNRPGEALDVSIQVFTVSGKLIKSIDTYASTDSYRVGPIDWNGLDEYGDKIGRGVYIYKIKVTAPSGESVDQFEKLVILQ